MKLDFEILPDQSGRHVAARVAWFNNDRFYPRADWIDNAEVLLGWWLGALTRLATGSVDDRLVFMEGPYALHLHRNRAERSLVVRPSDRSFEWRADLAEMAANVLSACKHLRDFAGKNVTPVNEQGFLTAEEALRAGIHRIHATDRKEDGLG